MEQVSVLTSAELCLVRTEDSIGLTVNCSAYAAMLATAAVVAKAVLHPVFMLAHCWHGWVVERTLLGRS